MEFFKRRRIFGTSTSDTEAPSSQLQPQPPIQAFNNVSYTNPKNNQPPIIIGTTHQSPSKITVIQKQENTTLKVPDMTTPTDSFHSVSTTVNEDERSINKRGKVNLAFTGSSMDVNKQLHHSSNQQHRHEPNEHRHPESR